MLRLTVPLIHESKKESKFGKNCEISSEQPRLNVPKPKIPIDCIQEIKEQKGKIR